jgi:hypothetical protein
MLCYLPGAKIKRKWRTFTGERAKTDRSISGSMKEWKLHIYYDQLCLIPALMNVRQQIIPIGVLSLSKLQTLNCLPNIYYCMC